MKTIRKYVSRMIASCAAIICIIVFTIIGYSSLTNSDNKPDNIIGSIGFTINDIGELATTEYGYTMVETTSKPHVAVAGFKIPFTESKVIYSYDGLIKAGIDFTEIDVKTNYITKKIYITLPEAKVLSSEVFYDSLLVYDEQNSPFNAFTFEDMNLSVSNLKTTAEESAISKGILETAKENAETIVNLTIRNLPGTEKYEVEFN